MNTNFERVNYRNIKKKNNLIKCNYYKIICVLCGGIQEDGTPHEFVKKRLDVVYKLYKNDNNVFILILGGGTYHKPPFINKDRFIVHESTSCAEYLYNKGVEAQKILREWSSYDTIANGFFAFSNYLNYLNISKMVLVTSDFHIDRSKTIFNYFNTLFNKNIDIKYIEVESNLPPEIYSIRFEREKKSKENFEINIVNKIKDIKSFILWFYTEHKAYMSILEYKNNENINTTY